MTQEYFVLEISDGVYVRSISRNRCMMTRNAWEARRYSDSQTAKDSAWGVYYQTNAALHPRPRRLILNYGDS